MASKFTILFFFVCGFSLSLCSEFKNEDFISSVEDKMESKFGEYTGYLTKWFKSINDKNLLRSDVGRMLHYEDLEPKVERAGKNVESRNLKKVGSILPLIFHLGMTSAWMLLTTLLTAKSVAIGMTLLVLKIAVGSAKLASYFTAWKHSKHHHYEYIPHHEHHGHKRSLRSIETHLSHHQDWQGYAPEYSSYTHQEASPYHAQAPAYGGGGAEYEYPAEKAQDKKIIDDDEDNYIEAKKKMLKLKPRNRKVKYHS